MFRLDNPLQRYDWGSRHYVQDLLGLAPDGRPVAEMWLGAHPPASSSVASGAHAGAALTELVRSAPERLLGSATVARFGPRLPYLLKVLAAERPLSLQVHPNAEQAEEGFRREEAAGVPTTAPHRSFKDTHHKPEMLLALTRVEALCGFRDPDEALDVLTPLAEPALEPVRAVLADGGPEATVRALAHVLADQRLRSPRVTAALGDRVRRAAAAGSPWADAYRAVADLASLHPQDSGVVAALLLHHVTLEPGEALFLEPGVLHAYLRGAGVEVMAASDNVLRAGLTSKHVDVDLLLDCTDPSPRAPHLVPTTPVADGVLRYAPDVEEFALVRARLDDAARSTVASAGPRVVLCLDGELQVRSSAGEVVLGRGESLFVGDDAGDLDVGGPADAVVALVPV